MLNSYPKALGMDCLKDVCHLWRTNHRNHHKSWITSCLWSIFDMNFRKEVTLESPVSPTSLFDIGGIVKVDFSSKTFPPCGGDTVSIFEALNMEPWCFFIGNCALISWTYNVKFAALLWQKTLHHIMILFQASFPLYLFTVMKLLM